MSRDNYFDVNLLFQELTAVAARSVGGGEDMAVPHGIPRKTSAPRGRLIGWLVGGGGAAVLQRTVEAAYTVEGIDGGVEHSCPLKRTDTKQSVRPYAIGSLQTCNLHFIIAKE